jgi:uncharacterized protein YceH (UPF0502 family)
LEDLFARKDGPFVIKLERESGKRDARYAHLFSGPVDTAASHSTYVDAQQSLDASNQENRIVALEQEVASLREELLALKQVFDL